MKLVAKTALVSLALTAAAAAHATPQIQLEGAPDLVGDCNDPMTQVRLVPTAQGSTFDLLVPSLDAEADDTQPRVRKFCNIRQTVRIPHGYKLAPRSLTYQGLSDIAADGGSANISARYFLSGTLGLDGFRSFRAGEQGNFDVTTFAGQPSYTRCGGTAELNFQADMTARVRPGNGSYSQLTVSRGVGEVDVPRGYSVFKCGVQIIPCH